ncbi:hypothetical protein ACFSQD_00535 [Flavihumibacter stibioxidans]|uniref:Uncharacterized protein n=1 Tax=Flavihumibacter stibioxidans TaxID=1834163 RepID=A0ABR7MD91_9BACT|nr:hypothetical protein [Flavihumibacter stibioxidans]MBC6492987.1 hypothetical protein [Flavihumibacter stibioxidans]
MKIRLFAIGLILLAATGIQAQGPRVVYSEPEKDDTRRTNFEILGKLGNEFLIYKNNRSSHTIGVYDNDMKLLQNVNLDFMPDKMINMDYIAYPDRVMLFYQYQKRRVVYCDYVVVGENGRLLTQPATLDTTEINFSSNNKIYTVVNSDDKQKIMLFKVNSSDPRKFILTSFLYNARLEQITRNRSEIPMQERNEYFSDFHLSNSGELVVAKFSRAGSNSDFIAGVTMMIKYPDSLGFSTQDVNIGKQILDNLLMKIDNNNNRVLISSFYSKQKRGNMEGVYIVDWDKAANKKIMDTAIFFSDELRVLAKGNDANKKTAFNDFFIKNILTRKDGGFVIISEALYTTSRYSNFNRWDYMGWGNPWMSPLNYGYWSPMYSPYGMPWNRYGWNNNTQNRYFAENVLVLSFDRTGKMEWSNVITKSQYDDESDNLVSYGNMNTGGEVHFLFNTFERRTFVLTDQSLDATGKITRYPTFKNLDKGYEFMPRFAKQVSARQILIPCLYRNYLCFSRVDF